MNFNVLWLLFIINDQDMEGSFKSEKIKLLEMQASYLRYLASVYPGSTSSHESPQSSVYSSLSPIRTFRESHQYDDLPVKKVEKPFEQLLEEQLQQNPSFVSPKSTTQSLNFSNSSNIKYLKRGQGKLCSFSPRNYSSSMLTSIRNKLLFKELEKKTTPEFENISNIKQELEEKTKKLKKEEKQLIKKKNLELKEIKKSQQIFSKKDETQELKKKISQMIEADKIKDFKHKEEIKKLNTEILKLNKKLSQLIKFSPSSTFLISSKSVRNSPEKRVKASDSQGKIKKFVEAKIAGIKGRKEDCGYNVTHFKNNDVKKTYPDGKTVYIYAESQTVLTTFPNGFKVYEYSDGQVEKLYACGRKVVNFPDGAVKTIFEDASEEIVYPDGTVKTISSLGNEKIVYPDGSIKFVNNDSNNEDFDE